MLPDPILCQQILNQIQLPRLVPIPLTQPLFPIQQRDEDKEIDANLQQKSQELVAQLNKTFEVFQDPNGFVFQFPKSKFPDVPAGERNMITYEQKNIVEEEDTFKNRLSQEQLAQIAETGEFKVRSNIEYITLPYVWKVNPRIFWGKQRMSEAWNQGVASVYNIMYTSYNFMLEQVPAAATRILNIPRGLFGIFFGRRKMRLALTVDYDREVKKAFWTNVMERYYSESHEWGSVLWNYIFVHFEARLHEPILQQNPDMRKIKQEEQQKAGEKFQKQVDEVNRRKNVILSVQAQFNSKWGKLKKKVFAEVNQECNNMPSNNSVDYGSNQEDCLKKAEEAKDELILEKLGERKFTLYLEHLNETLPGRGVPRDVVAALVLILQLFRFINARLASVAKEFGRRQQAVRRQFKEEHPILCHVSAYEFCAIAEQLKPLREDVYKSFFEQLKGENEFTRRLNAQQRAVYDIYLHYRSYYESLVVTKKSQMKQMEEPTRIFYSTYMLAPPYQVFRDANNYYQLKKESDHLTVDTSSSFWKVKLYCMRVKTWSVNIVIFLVYSIWLGPVGFRCLFGVVDFEYNTNINYETGALVHSTRHTVIGQFLQVMKGVTDSRNAFQALPDRGLFGKNISRICNYFECYIFRFLIVGVFITLIGYPILILLCSSILTVMMFTFWAWLPVIMLLTYLFNIFIYQFESSYQYGTCFFRCFPILSVVLAFIKDILIILWALLLLCILSPLGSFFALLWVVIRQLFRITFDALILCLIGRLGRVPSHNTSMAWKISGPGMSKEYYMSITQEDVYVLTQAQLQRIYMAKYYNQLRQAIIGPWSRFLKVISFLLRPFNCGYNNYNNPIQNNYNEININMQRQYLQYMNRFPQQPRRIRFTQEEIDAYFQNSIAIVRNFVKKHEMEGWVFDQYQLYPDMYDELTRAIWIQIFNCGEEIFEPLEKLDQRFKLEDQYAQDAGINESMKKNVSTVMRALEGEVSLIHKHEKITQWKHNLLQRDQNDYPVSGLFNLHSSNSVQAVSLLFDDPRSTFVPHLNINELCKKDNFLRQAAIRANPRLTPIEG